MTTLWSLYYFIFVCVWGGGGGGGGGKQTREHQYDSVISKSVL